MVFAVDIEPAMVGYLTKRAATERLPNMRGGAGVGGVPNFPSLWTWCWSWTRSTTSAIAPPISPACASSLQPGGRIAIIDFRKDAPGKARRPHFRFTPEQISADMAGAGFVLDAQPRLPAAAAFLVYRSK